MEQARQNRVDRCDRIWDTPLLRTYSIANLTSGDNDSATDGATKCKRLGNGNLKCN